MCACSSAFGCTLMLAALLVDGNEPSPACNDRPVSWLASCSLASIAAPGLARAAHSGWALSAKIPQPTSGEAPRKLGMEGGMGSRVGAARGCGQPRGGCPAIPTGAEQPSTPQRPVSLLLAPTPPSHASLQRRAPRGLWLGPAVPGERPRQAGQIRRAGAAACPVGDAGRAGSAGARGAAGGLVPLEVSAVAGCLVCVQALPLLPAV